MVYVDPLELKWMPYVKSWLQKSEHNDIITDKMTGSFLHFFENYVEEGLVFFKKHCSANIDQVFLQLS